MAGSTTFRSQSGIILLTACGTALVTYLICSSIIAHQPTQPGLQRRPAVRRRRRQRSANAESGATVSVGPAGDQAPTSQPELSPPVDRPSVSDLELQRALYYVAMDRAAHNGVIHHGVVCNSCSTTPIRGIRYHCANCPDYDLCSDCEASSPHPINHVFYAIRIPAPYLAITPQDPFYPGDPGPHRHNLPLARAREIRTNFSAISEEEIISLHDQFHVIADRDGNLDKDEFIRAIHPWPASSRTPPNIVYERLYRHFEKSAPPSKTDDSLGFSNFIVGLHRLRCHIDRPDAVFDFYDIDEDGRIGRDDVLRILKAQYEIEKEARHRLIGQNLHEIINRDGTSLIQSNKNLAAAFAGPMDGTTTAAGGIQPRWVPVPINQAPNEPLHGGISIQHGSSTTGSASQQGSEGGSVGAGPEHIEGLEIPEAEDEPGEGVINVIVEDAFEALIDRLFAETDTLDRDEFKARRNLFQSSQAASISPETPTPQGDGLRFVEAWTDLVKF